MMILNFNILTNTAFIHNFNLKKKTKINILKSLDNLNNNDNQWVNFKSEVDNIIQEHPIVKDNNYTRYFKSGNLSKEELSHFVIQFSVFSNLFLKSQLLKVINAPSLEEAREGKEILLNELGVIFNNKQDNNNILSTKGTIQGGIYKHEAAHFEWLLKVAKYLDLNYNDLGKMKHANKETIFFINQLEKLYGSPDDLEAIAASYAIENWAASGFWDELTIGFKKYNYFNNLSIPISFWLFHSKLEQNHADHTNSELKKIYESSRIQNETKFFEICQEMLEALQIFWRGMYL